MGKVEPVFANTHDEGMRRFTLRGQKKVSALWKLFTLAVVARLGFSMSSLGGPPSSS
jgi:hypothetical protein